MPTSLLLRAPLLTAATVLAVLAAFAPTARAQVEEDPGVSENTLITPCVYGGAPKIGVKALAMTQHDRSNRPKVGDVFYANALVAAVSTACVYQLTSIEVVPPVGVELAISAANPVRCVYDDTQGNRQTVTPAQGCPQQATPGAYGFKLDRSGTSDGLWPLEGPTRPTTLPWAALQIDIPLRSSRPLKALAAGSVSCGRRLNFDPPCPPDRAADDLQVGYRVVDGYANPWLVPHIGLIVEPGSAVAAAAPAPAATTAAPVAGQPALSLGVSRSLPMRSALKGIPVTVNVPADGIVRVVLRTSRVRGLKGGLIARVTKRARAGALKLRLKPSRRAARALRARRVVIATLRVTVTPTAGTPQTVSARLRLRR